MASVAPLGANFSSCQARCSSRTPRRFEIFTLAAVLDGVNQSMPRPQLARLRYAVNKGWYQVIKKVYGCLAFDSRGTCFLVDSEGLVLRCSMCHAASEYLAKRTVWYSPYPHPVHTDHNRIVEMSRRILGGPAGESFGEGFMMESYHWIWEVELLRDFLAVGLRGESLVALGYQHVEETAADAGAYEQKKKRDPSYEPGHPFLEETFYHHLYPRRHSLGYRFVNVYQQVERVVGPTGWALMLNSSLHLPNPGKALVEIICTHLPSAGPDAEGWAERLAAFYRHSGMLMGRCRTQSEPCRLLSTAWDVCVSSGGKHAALSDAQQCHVTRPTGVRRHAVHNERQ